MSLHLHIPTPCHEDWQQMLPEEKGRHCLACQKTVIDFTQMSDAEIAAFFRQKPASVCGRFKKEQLTPKATSTTPLSRWKMYLLALSATVAMKSMSTDRAKAQVPIEQREPQQFPLVLGKIAATPPTEDFTLSGKITDVGDKSPLPGVSVSIKGTTKGTSTNANGEFHLSNVKKGDTLVVNFIGYVTEEKIIHSENDVTIAMEPDIKGMLGEVRFPLHKRIFYRVKSWFQ